MQVDVENSETNKCLVKIKMDKPEVDRETQVAALSLKDKVDVPGFRRGTAPIELVKTRYRDHVLAEAAEKLVYQGTASALKDKKLKNVSDPELLQEFRVAPKKKFLGRFAVDGTFHFAVQVEMPPELDVKDYKGVAVKTPSNTTSFDNWFAARIKQQQFMYGTKRASVMPARINDEVIADFEGSIDGKVLEGGKEEGFRVVIGSAGMPDAFEQAFVGKSVGDEFAVIVEFPNDYSNEAWKGKQVEFACHVREISEIIPHDLDDTFAMLNGHSTVVEMKQQHRDAWEQEFAQPMRTQLMNSIMEAVLAKNEFVAPKSWVEKETEMTIRRLNAQGLRGNDSAMSALRSLSERTVKFAYLLEKIYEKESSLHLSSADFIAIADKEGQKYGLSGMEFIQRLKNDNHYEGFVVLQEQERVIDFLIANAVQEELV